MSARRRMFPLRLILILLLLAFQPAARDAPAGETAAGADGATSASQFRKGLFNVLDYGANGNDSLNDWSAIRDAVRAASGAGSIGVSGFVPGGVVLFPKGKYLLRGAPIEVESCKLYGPHAELVWTGMEDGDVAFRLLGNSSVEGFILRDNPPANVTWFEGLSLSAPDYIHARLRIADITAFDTGRHGRCKTFFRSGAARRENSILIDESDKVTAGCTLWLDQCYVWTAGVALDLRPTHDSYSIRDSEFLFNPGNVEDVIEGRESFAPGNRGHDGIIIRNAGRLTCRNVTLFGFNRGIRSLFDPRAGDGQDGLVTLVFEAGTIEQCNIGVFFDGKRQLGQNKFLNVRADSLYQEFLTMTNIPSKVNAASAEQPAPASQREITIADCRLSAHHSAAVWLEQYDAVYNIHHNWITVSSTDTLPVIHVAHNTAGTIVDGNVIGRDPASKTAAQESSAPPLRFVNVVDLVCSNNVVRAQDAAGVSIQLSELPGGGWNNAVIQGNVCDGKISRQPETGRNVVVSGNLENTR